MRCAFCQHKQHHCGRPCVEKIQNRQSICKCSIDCGNYECHGKKPCKTKYERVEGKHSYTEKCHCKECTCKECSETTSCGCQNCDCPKCSRLKFSSRIIEISSKVAVVVGIGVMICGAIFPLYIPQYLIVVLVFGGGAILGTGLVINALNQYHPGHENNLENKNERWFNIEEKKPQEEIELNDTQLFNETF